MERETGFEPATSTLARLHSTTELLPQRRVCGIRGEWKGRMGTLPALVRASIFATLFLLQIGIEVN